MTGEKDPRSIVRESYDRLDRQYAAWASAVDNTSRRRWTQYLLEQLPPGKRVLDLGCGDGSLLTWRLAIHFAVVGVDLSSVQLARARKKIPRAEFICADMTSLTFPSETFDAVSAFYSLTHLPPDSLPQMMRSIARWLKPDGIFVGSFGASEDSGSVQEDWLGVPMYFSGHDPDTNRQMVEQAGLSIEQDSIETAVELDAEVTFHWIAARKRPST